MNCHDVEQSTRFPLSQQKILCIQGVERPVTCSCIIRRQNVLAVHCVCSLHTPLSKAPQSTVTIILVLLHADCESGVK